MTPHCGDLRMKPRPSILELSKTDLLQGIFGDVFVEVVKGLVPIFNRTEMWGISE
jgi:hypothetical protein